MPRQDVPYGGAICRLKERIAEIWDELGKKLHSINGVEGDAAGDVKIVSGDPAVVITSDQVNHQIEVALDSSQLPAASVSSVNGQTGAVALDAGDIPTVGGDVQSDIQDLANDISGNTAAINAEALARQNADATLQGNINTLSASIPTAAATAVANDPTVAQLATDVPNKVDKITSGSSLKAYTHTGATQGETPISSGTDANSIGLRDADGRMHGADPASGATDKTLVTANWVSQTGDSGPNNLLHKTAAETADGVKTFNDRIIGTALLSYRIGLYGYSGWYKAIDLGAVANYIQTKITVFTASYRVPTQYAELFINNNGTPQIVAIISKGSDNNHANPANYGVMVEDGHVIFYMNKLNTDMSMMVNVEYKTSYGTYVNAAVSVIAEQVSDPSSLTGFIPATLLVG